MLYDENIVLTQYIRSHYRNLRTEFEGGVEEALAIQEKFNQDKHRGTERDAIVWLKQKGLYNEQSRQAIENPDRFWDGVRDRILSEHEEDVFINRCPKCKKVVASPKARQCLWCGHDWH